MPKSDKKYNIVPTNKQLSTLKEGWKLFQEITDAYDRNVSNIETNISKKTGIKDIEFFFSDGGCVGIGNIARTMELIQREELEK